MILVWLKLFLLFWRIFEALMIIQTQLSSYWTLLVYFFPNKFFNFLRKSLIFPKSSDSTKKNLHVFLLIGTKTWFNRRGDISLYLEMCCGSAFDGYANLICRLCLYLYIWSLLLDLSYISNLNLCFGFFKTLLFVRS